MGTSLKRLLIVHNRYIHPGGEDACISNEMEALRDSGYHVQSFIVNNDSSFSTKRDALLSPWGRGPQAELEKLIQHDKPDLVHAHNLFPLLSPRVFKFAHDHGSKTIQTLHNFRPICLNGLFMTPSRELCERCRPGHYGPGILRGCYRGSRAQSIGMAAHLWAAHQREWYGEVDLFIAPSQFLKSKYEQFLPFKDRLVVQGHFSPIDHHPLPCPPSPYALYLGRLSEEKGILWLMECFKTSAGPLKLIVAGDGPLKHKLTNQSHAAIEYRGFVKGDEKQELLRHAMLLVLPSECYENFPLALMEANLLGVPVVAPSHGAFPELIQAGTNGETFPPHDADRFLSAIQSVSAQAQQLAYRTRCQDHASQRFSKGRAIANRLALYESVLRS